MAAGTKALSYCCLLRYKENPVLCFHLFTTVALQCAVYFQFLITCHRYQSLTDQYFQLPATREDGPA